MNAYKALKDKHQAEVNAFPMKFAFGEDQFKRMMKEFGLRQSETDKILTCGGGCYYQKSDAPALHDMFARHAAERKSAMDADATGDGYLYHMFLYELANHEFGYTGTYGDTLADLGLTLEQVRAEPRMNHALEKASERLLRGA